VTDVGCGLLAQASRAVSPDTADRPARAAAMSINGTAHSSVAASSIAWFMKSTASTWCRRYSAQDPAYVFLPAGGPGSRTGLQPGRLGRRRGRP
jgi:hypothetical protein